MDIEPIAYFRSPLKSKFGVPRQSGIAAELKGTIVMTGEWNDAECLRGLEDFDYLWLLWGFSENVAAQKHATVRPPRLGGNRRMGVFATRSSFRPNNIGLSSVRILKINALPGKEVEIEVAGADLMDGTPIYDIKPYLPQFDAHPNARAGFTETHEWTRLNVIIPEDIRQQLGETRCRQLREILAEDPRPQYHDSPERVYGMPFDGYDIKFRVVDNSLIIINIDLL
ncbi:MAG: tRNA (N6-threonylcarbamoyladenosine(37)-N6)-methyltransferase TrmO [Prevotella sp.]